MALTMAGASHTVDTRERSSSSTTAAASNVRWMIVVAPAGDERGRREIERPHVIQRPAREAQVRVRETELNDVGQVLPGQVGVRDHHALRAARGARGVHETVDVVGLGGDGLRQVPSASSSASVVHPGAATPAMHDRTMASSRPAVACVASSSSASSHTSARASECSRMNRTSGAASRQLIGHGDGPEAVRREHRLEELRAVVREQGDDVAGSDPPGLPPAGQRPGSGLHLGVGEHLAFEHRDRLFRRARRVMGQYAEPVDVRPHRPCPSPPKP